MRFLNKLAAVTFLLLLKTQFIFTQECVLPSNSKESIVEKVEKRNLDNYKGWKKFSNRDLTFYAPVDLKGSVERCIHGDCNSFANGRMNIYIDRDPAAFYPRFHKSYPEYKEKGLCINGRLAWYWSYPDKDKKDSYYAGAFFYFDENPKRRLVMLFSFKDRDLNQIAEKIVKSVEIIK